ncbi:MAG: YraN family protein [Bacteroidales bacterium]|jgi:putative endonuclease|nr:YraN family protein [Bacteroidales bacterium]
MADHNDTGKKGEALAAAFLEKKGYTILERNWRNVHQEIDIIARHRDDEIAVVEVKCRSAHPLSEPRLSVTREKQKLLIRAADAYIRKKDIDAGVRFDIIAVIMSDPVRIEHIEGAFSTLWK